MSKDSGGKRRSRSSSGGGGKTSTSGRSRSQSARFETCSYSLVVRTSAEKGAGADANVFVQLTDSEGNQTDKCRLKCSITHRKKFRRGHVSAGKGRLKRVIPAGRGRDRVRSVMFGG